MIISHCFTLVSDSDHFTLAGNTDYFTVSRWKVTVTISDNYVTSDSFILLMN